MNNFFMSAMFGSPLKIFLDLPMFVAIPTWLLYLGNGSYLKVFETKVLISIQVRTYKFIKYSLYIVFKYNTSILTEIKKYLSIYSKTCT